MFLAGLMLLVGCGRGVSKDNYDKIENDMTVEQVKGLLGEPDADSSAGGVSVGGLSAESLTWTDGEKTITVGFANGKVVSKAAKGLGE